MNWKQLDFCLFVCLGIWRPITTNQPINCSQPSCRKTKQKNYSAPYDQMKFIQFKHTHIHAKTQKPHLKTGKTNLTNDDDDDDDVMSWKMNEYTKKTDKLTIHEQVHWSSKKKKQHFPKDFLNLFLILDEWKKWK